MGGDSFSKERERRAVIVLSVLLILFSLGIAGKAGYNLATELRPYEVVKLMTVCTLGFCIYLLLGWAKLFVSKKLNSQAVFLDAVSTFAATATAIALICSLVVRRFTRVWVLDSVVAIVVSFALMVYAAITL